MTLIAYHYVVTCSESLSWSMSHHQGIWVFHSGFLMMLTYGDFIKLRAGVEWGLIV